MSDEAVYLGIEKKKKEKKLWPKLLLALLMPLFFLFLLEGAFRLLGVGKPEMPNDFQMVLNGETKYFVSVEGREGFVRINQELKIRQDNKQIPCFKDRPFSIKKKKGISRILILGGSNVYGMEHVKEAFLDTFKKNHPGKTPELIFAGGLSYGTTRLLPLLKEALEFDLDQVIIYSGHNEFAELPTIIEKPGKRNFIAHLGQKSYLVYFLLNIKNEEVEDIKEIDEANSSERPRFFLSDDLDPVWRTVSDYQVTKNVYKHYQENLEAMAKLAKEKGVPVILSTVCSNDLSFPMNPGLQKKLSGDERKEFKKLTGPLERSWLDKKYGEAEKRADEILKKYPKYAGALFVKGEALFKQGKFKEAKPYLEKSAIYDFCPRKATPQTNEAIKNAAKNAEAVFLDISGKLRSKINAGITSELQFADQCHFNTEYYKHVLESFAKEVE